MASVAVVTGASGYVATELVKQLLEKGYTVKGTVRSTSKTDKIEHLLKLGEALPGKLTLHEADNLVEGSFDDVVKGADFVFHTASPYLTKSDNPQKDLVDPAVNGTTNLLKAVAKSKDTVKRVVLTSSVAAVLGMALKTPPKTGNLYSEEDWNVDSTLETAPYPLSKVEAEKAAWAFAKAEGIDLVVICPSQVFGPVISGRSDATSIEMFKDYVENGNDIRLTIQVDVRDIGRAHVLAAEVKGASGRYILSHSNVIGPHVAYKALSERFPQYSFAPKEDTGAKDILDNSKVQKELGLVFHPMQETYIDMAVTLIQKGILKPKSA